MKSKIYKIKPLQWRGQIQTTGTITTRSTFVYAYISKVPKERMEDIWDRYVAYIAFDEIGDELTCRFNTVSAAKEWVREKWEKRLKAILLEVVE